MKNNSTFVRFNNCDFNADYVLLDRFQFRHRHDDELDVGGLHLRSGTHLSIASKAHFRFSHYEQIIIVLLYVD